MDGGVMRWWCGGCSGRGRGGRGGGGDKRQKTESLSAEDLDKDLDDFVKGNNPDAAKESLADTKSDAKPKKNGL